jgi:translocation and assembly module TamA
MKFHAALSLFALVLALPALFWPRIANAQSDASAAAPAAETTSTESVPSTVLIYFKGVEDKPLRQALLREVQLRAVRKDKQVTEAQIRRLYRAAPEQIQRALEPFGYYQVSVEPSLVRVKERFKAVFNITLGPRVQITLVDFRISGPAEMDKTVASAWRKTGLKVTDPFDHALYERAKNDVQRALAGRGYLDAELVRHEVLLSRANNTAEVYLAWESGERYAIGETTFSGAQFPREFLNRYISYDSGDLYTQTRLLDLQKRLVDADYFSIVEVAPETDAAKDQQVPITVLLAPAKRSIYTYGLSLGTDSGVGVRGGLERRWVNDRGHKLRSAAEISQRLKAAAVSYELPQPDRNRTNYAINLSYRDEDTDVARSQVAKIGFARSREWKGWQQTYAIQGLQGDFTVGGERGSSTLLYPEAIWYKRVADDLVYPNQGYALTLSARAGAEALLSDTNFAALNADYRYITTLGAASRFLARVGLGALYVDTFTDLPPELRYFAGGDRSLRGYSYQELGPTNASGNVRGGKYLALLSGEYERRINESWAIAGFVDTGNAFDENSSIKTGVGAGLRWRSPVGLVRLDLAFAVDEPDSPARLHLIIGPDL